MRINTGDIWAGLAAAAVILPQAMAFGVTLLVPFQIDAATGALVGLIGAASLSLSSGLFGGTRGLVSAPTGPVLVLMTGAAAALTNAGMGGPALLTGLAAMMVMTGLFQALIGLSGGGQLIKFIPYPVVAGFMTGSAVLMILSQIDPVLGNGGGSDWESWRWLPPLTAVATYAIMALLPRLLPKVPGTIAGLLGGILVFQGIAALGPGAIPDAWVIGTLPGPEALNVGFSLAALAEIPWRTVTASALALAVLASVDTLLTSVIADVETRTRHDARRELIGQGVGQILSGLLGGMGGAGTTGATVVSTRTGGRRWAGVSTGITFALLILFFGPVGNLVPISVLAGIIVFVAVHMLEMDVLAWMRRRRMRTDGLIALLVTTVTVAYDLMIAVGVGVAIAVLLFVREQVRAPVIHRRSTAVESRSVRARPEEHRTLLNEHGERIIIYELRGNLFFATADRLFEQMTPDLDRKAWVILNMRRVSQVDLTGVKILQQISSRLNAQGGELLFTNVYRQVGLGRNVAKTLHKVSPHIRGARIKTFNDVDEAKEYAEDALLEELGVTPVPSDLRMQLGDMELCRHMQPPQVEALSAALRSHTLNKGQRVFAAGDFGDQLYIVAQGEVDIRLQTSRYHHKRLAKCGPGTLLGEVAFLEPGPRLAEAVAVRPSELLELDQDGFDKLRNESPATAIALLTALARTQGNYLRWSAKELHRLAQW